MDAENIEDAIEIEEPSKRSPTNSAMKSVFAGAGAGVITAVVCAPLDVIKIRLQIQGSLGLHEYGGNARSMLKKIYTEEGVAGLFKGVGPALLTVPIFWAVYWPLYAHNKTFIAEYYPELNTSIVHLLSAVVAGAAGDILTNPFWVTRTRIQTLILHPEAHLKSNVGTVEMMQSIYRREGVKAFYKGLGASFLGLSHVAIQFPLCT